MLEIEIIKAHFIDSKFFPDPILFAHVVSGLTLMFQFIQIITFQAMILNVWATQSFIRLHLSSQVDLFIHLELCGFSQ